jgi:hypothetical protein
MDENTKVVLYHALKNAEWLSLRISRPSNPILRPKTKLLELNRAVMFKEMIDSSVIDCILNAAKTHLYIESSTLKELRVKSDEIKSMKSGSVFLRISLQIVRRFLKPYSAISQF